MLDIRNFTKGASVDAIARLNKMVEVARQVKQITSDDFVSVRQSPNQATSHGLNLNMLRQRLRLKGTGTGIDIHHAFCKTDAPASSDITCYLDTDGTGEEITVHCDICGGGTLDSALPHLADGQRISVWKKDGEWYCTALFRIANICEE